MLSCFLPTGDFVHKSFTKHPGCSCYNGDMDKELHILPPEAPDDSAGAERVLLEFSRLYQPVFIGAVNHLDIVITRMTPEYSDAYRPWRNALHDISRGLHLMGKKIPLSDMERFMEALLMFTFEGAIQFLHDICRIGKIT